MTSYRLLAAAAALAVMTVPAMAQQVISEPGYCAFFYPNANCQNKGPGNPYTDPNFQRRYYQGDPMAAAPLRRSASQNGGRAIPRHACSDGESVTPCLAANSVDGTWPHQVHRLFV